MSKGDSKAQQEHERENRLKKATVERDQIIVDKKLEGENRPAE